MILEVSYLSGEYFWRGFSGEGDRFFIRVAQLLSCFYGLLFVEGSTARNS